MDMISMILKRVSASDGSMLVGWRFLFGGDGGGGFFAWGGIEVADTERMEGKEKRSKSRSINGRDKEQYIVMENGEGQMISCSSCNLDGFTSEFHFMFCAEQYHSQP